MHNLVLMCLKESFRRCQCLKGLVLGYSSGSHAPCSDLQPLKSNKTRNSNEHFSHFLKKKDDFNTDRALHDAFFKCQRNNIVSAYWSQTLHVKVVQTIHFGFGFYLEKQTTIYDSIWHSVCFSSYWGSNPEDQI